MKTKLDGKTLRVSDILELNAVNSSAFRLEVSAAMPADIECLEIDLSMTRFVDSSGLGALFALYKRASKDGGVAMRIIQPRPSVRQLLELTQLHQLFEIVQVPPPAA